MVYPDTTAGHQARRRRTAPRAAPAIGRLRRSLFVLTILGALAAAAAGLTTSVAVAEPLAPKAFTEEFVRVLAPKVAAGGITVKGDLSLSVRTADGSESTVSLANAYRDYLRDPTSLETIISTYVAALSAPMRASRLDRSRIVPVIRDRQWIDDVRAQVASDGSASSPMHKVETFNNELVIVYAEDEPTRTRYIPAGEDIGVADGELRALAIDNLRRMLPKITLEAHVDIGIVRVSAGGDYDASLLLLDEIWSGGQIKVEGDIVVAVPARDVLLVTGSRSRNGLKVLRAMVADVIKGSHRLTDTLFVYRNGRFVRFGRS